MFGQHSAGSSIGGLCVRYVGRRGRFIFCLGGFMALCLLSAVSIILKNGGEKFQFLVEGVLITEGCGSVYQGSKNRSFVEMMVM
jgi:hypothetical protein